jgi:FixJ family two-component response regulator
MHDRMIPFRQPVLLVGQDERLRAEIQQALFADGLQSFAFGAAADYLASGWLMETSCLILDVELCDMSGFDLQQRLGATCPPVMFVSRSARIDHAVRAMKAGALEFVTWPFEPHGLVRNVRNAIALDSRMRADRERVWDLRARHARLTPRQVQVFQFVVSGVLNKQIAAQLGISDITVQIHRREVMQRMGAASFAELVRIADVLGIPLQEGARCRTVRQESREPPPAILRDLRADDRQAGEHQAGEHQAKASSAHRFFTSCAAVGPP